MTVPGTLASTLFAPYALVLDSTPNPVTFTSVSAAGYGVVYYSNTVVLSGFNTPVTATVTGGTMRINGVGLWVTSGTVVSGDTVQLSLTSATTANTARTATLSLGGSNYTYTVTSSVIGSYLDTFKSSQSGVTISNNTMTAAGNLATNATAYCSGLVVPKDGVQYYWETDVPGVTYYTHAVNGSTSVPTSVANYRCKAQWVAASNAYRIAIYGSTSGAMTAWTTLSVNIDVVSPAVSRIAAGSVHLRLAASEFQYDSNGGSPLIGG